MNLLLEKSEREELWKRLISAIEDYTERVASAPVTPEMNPEKIRALLAPLDFTCPMPPQQAVDFIVDALWRYETHVAHPRYFGLFNPAPTTMSIAGDLLAAAFNPQLAAWSKSPIGVEIEQHLIRAFGARFGFDPQRTDGTFTSGGMEANHTAVLTALTHKFPDWTTRGLRALPQQPTLYVSAEAHHSFLKAARMTGLGADAVREIPVDADARMNVAALAAQIERDRKDGVSPFLVIATGGTTNAGIIDAIPAIASVAEREQLWMHADAAWGGAVVLVPELRHVLAGIERADSITFDAHKWLSTPMGAGIYLTRHPGILHQTFRMRAGGYMPREAAGLDVVHPWEHSMQWSRRFIGLKVFLSLLVAGWDGYTAAIRHQVEMARLLSRRLQESGWQVVNDPSLAVVCFTHPTAALESVCARVVSSGVAWLSPTMLAGRLVLRACITNYRTQPSDIETLVSALGSAKSA